jgi:hypothetical protein
MGCLPNGCQKPLQSLKSVRNSGTRTINRLITENPSLEITQDRAWSCGGFLFPSYPSWLLTECGIVQAEMIDRNVRKMLDENGIEVVRAVYVKELAVAALPRHRDRPVPFNNGQASLGSARVGAFGSKIGTVYPFAAIR